MNITHAFLGEHGVLYAQLDVAESLLGEEPGLETTRALARVLAATLKPHAVAENELLFDPAARKSGERAGPLTVMHEDHDEIEGLLVEAGAADTAERIRDLLLGAIGLAREHFRREEAIAFGRAAAVLGDEELERAGREWAARRDVRLAP